VEVELNRENSKYESNNLTVEIELNREKSKYE